MAVAIRVIPCLDVHDGRVVKGVNFLNLRDAGDPVELARAYGDAGADEASAASLAPRRRPDPATPSPGAVSSGAAADPVDATTLAQVKAAIAAVPGGAGKAEVLAAAALPEDRWTTVISALLATGEVVRVGERRGARYFLAGQGPNPRSTQ